MSRYFNPSPMPEVPMPMPPGVARDQWGRPQPFPMAHVEVNNPSVPKKYRRVQGVSQQRRRRRCRRRRLPAPLPPARCPPAHMRTPAT